MGLCFHWASYLLANSKLEFTCSDNFCNILEYQNHNKVNAYALQYRWFSTLLGQTIDAWVNTVCSPLRHKFGQCWLAIDETVVLQEKYTSFFLFFLLSLFQFFPYFFRSLCVHMYLQRISYPSCHALRSCTACYHQIGQVITSVCVRLSALCFNTRLVSESSLNL